MRVAADDKRLVVAITGAGQGIGRGLALAFARGAARAVVVCDIDAQTCEQTAAAVRGLGIEALARRADVTQADELIVVSDAYTAEDRRRSFDLIAEAAGLPRTID